MIKKKQSFLKGIMILLSAQVIVKILGLAYRLVITNMDGFGDIGNGLYTSGQQIYMLLLAISSAGVPSAISKLVSERIAIGENREAHKIFKVALLLFGILGGISSIVLFIFSSKIAEYIGNPSIKNILIVLSPGIFFVSISSVIRGYFNGMCDMRATSTSQVIEQFAKSMLIILFVLFFSKITLDDTSGVSQLLINNRIDRTLALAMVASSAAVVATIINTFYLVFFYSKRKREIWKEVNISRVVTKSKTRDIIKKILKIAIPISFAAIIGALNKNIDNFTVVNCLKVALKNSYDSAAAITSEATRLYGILSGKIDALIGLPIALNVPFATALVPDISACVAEKRKDKVEKRINISIQTTLLIAIPCAIGMYVFADIILKLLFPNAYSAEAVTLLRISSFSIFFILINQTLGGIYQGLGKVLIPICTLLVSSIIKLILNLTLIPNSDIGMFGGINGAAISSLAAQFLVMFLNLCILSKKYKIILLPKMTFMIIIKRLHAYGQKHFSIHKCKKH